MVCEAYKWFRTLLISMSEIILSNQIKDKIYTFRGLQVMLDRDLAVLYEVETRTLKQAIKRNIKRFPSDFMFQLDNKEINFLVSQNVIPSKKYLGGAFPYAFTEQGIANISSILTSDISIKMNIQIMRAFVNMRVFISKNLEIFNRLDNVERKQLDYDKKFEEVFNAIEDKDIKPKSAGQMGFENMGEYLEFGIEWSEKWSELSKREQQILILILENPAINRKKLSKKIGINPSAIQKHIDKLKDKEIIKREGGAKGGHWEVLE